MSSYVRARRGHIGFTLVELLVVIAIIGILAGIVVPNVVGYMRNARVARALSEIEGAEQGLLAALTDTQRSNFREFLISDGNPSTGLDHLLTIADPAVFEASGQVVDNIALIQRFYNDFFYGLLRQGRNSDFIKIHVRPEIRQKLGTSYQDLKRDPWDNQYSFWMGPQLGPSALRSYRIADGEDPDDFDDFDAYIYTNGEKTALDRIIPGNPPADNLPGLPAPRDLPVYIFSWGANKQMDALHIPVWGGAPHSDLAALLSTPEFWGGGDDINNWDSEAGWANAPR